MENSKTFITRTPASSFLFFSLFLRRKKLIGKLLLIASFSAFGQFSFSQKTDSTKKLNHFGAGVTVTNCGIAFVPAFSFGKPAVIFDMTAGRKLSFDPQLRFGLNGKPWTFIFSWRYKLLSKTKLRLIAGAHPALSFRPVSVTTDGVITNMTVARRFFSPDLTASYFVAKNTSLGVYYLYSRALDKIPLRNTQLISVNSNFSMIKLSDSYFIRFTPQAYYLKQAQYDGFYVASIVSLARKNFPVSISSILNKAIRTDIPGSDAFIWNLNITYSFNKIYTEK